MASPPEAAAPAAARAPRRRARFVDLRQSPFLRSFTRLGWPILRKEVRADFRKNRFFFTHLICLSVLAAGILFQVADQSAGAAAKPEAIGVNLFNTFFLIQFLVVAVIFPAFSASAIAEERSAQTLDLLLTTDLRATELVWGKFLACSVYCLIYIVATIPLLSISLLFAGVTLLDIGLAYLVLIGLTVLINIAGVFISSCFASALRSTVTLYLLSFGLLLWAWLRFGELFKEGATQTITGMLAGRSPDLLDLLPQVAWLLWLFALVFAYLFLLAANQLRPRGDDRTSKIRMLTFAGVLSFLLPPALAVWSRNVRPDQETLQRTLLGTVSALFLAVLFFTAAEPVTSRRLAERFGRWRGPWYPLRIFSPGPFWGLVYSMVLSLVSFLLLWQVWQGFDRAGRFPAYDYAACLVTLPIYLFAFGALGFFLSAAGFTPLYTRLTVLFIFIITLLLPVIFKITGRPDGLLSLYYLSPITLWDSLERGRPPGDGPAYLLYGAPIIDVARWLFGGMGVVCLALGMRLSRKKGHPLWSFRGSGQ